MNGGPSCESPVSNSREPIKYFDHNIGWLGKMFGSVGNIAGSERALFMRSFLVFVTHILIEFNISNSSPDPNSELQILRHNRDAMCVNSTQVCVFEQRHQERFS